MYKLIKNKKGIAFKNNEGKIFFMDKKDPSFPYLSKWENNLWDSDVKIVFEKENYGVIKLINPVIKEEVKNQEMKIKEESILIDSMKIDYADIEIDEGVFKKSEDKKIIYKKYKIEYENGIDIYTGESVFYGVKSDKIVEEYMDLEEPMKYKKQTLINYYQSLFEPSNGEFMHKETKEYIEYFDYKKIKSFINNPYSYNEDYKYVIKFYKSYNDLELYKKLES